MNLSKSILVLSLLAVAVFGFNACEKDENELNETKISKYHANESHNFGQNCMACHVSGGGAKVGLKLRAAFTMYQKQVLIQILLLGCTPKAMVVL